MKRKVLSSFIVLGIIITACGGNKETTSNSAPASVAPVEAGVMTTAEYKDGLALVSASDCATCHKLNEKYTGPSYLDIANKYEDNEKNIEMLADKIIKGGKGVWDQTPMLAHPNIKKEDAAKMVKYILLTKKL